MAVLEEVAGRAGPQRLPDPGPVCVLGEDSDPCCRVCRGDLPGRLDAIDPRHADIHQHHVGNHLLHQRDRLPAVRGRPDDLDPRHSGDLIAYTDTAGPERRVCRLSRHGVFIGETPKELGKHVDLATLVEDDPDEFHP